MIQASKGPGQWKKTSSRPLESPFELIQNLDPRSKIKDKS